MAAKKPTTKADATAPADPIVAVVSAAMVRRAMAFASDYDVRYYLNGVAIQPSKSGGVLVMASDGHTALVLHDPDGKADKPYILPFTKSKHGKALAERGAWSVTVSKAGRIEVADLNLGTLFIHPGQLIEGKFPDVAALVGSLDDYERGVTGAFNPDYLKRALDSAGTRGKYQGIAFYRRKGEHGDAAASLFTTPNGFGLVMPMRDDPALSRKLTKDFGGII